MTNILDGRKVSKEILLKQKDEVAKLHSSHIFPKIAVILVGKDDSSLAYVRQKQKACAFTGIDWVQFDYETDVTTDELIIKIQELNEDESVHGILVQLPLPEHVYEPDVIHAISPDKDVDGFTVHNLGNMFMSTEFEDFAPCTPLGVIRLLEYYDIKIEGTEVCVVGHSNIVGKPLSIMLLNRNATVTNCHSFTRNLVDHTLNADIICVGVGKRNLITADMVKDGVVIIDIGFNRTDDGKLSGDVDYESVSKKASYITPVPGGVGPMTVACLVENTVKAAKTLLA